MSSEVRFTLLSDGSSDRALLPVLRWLIEQHIRTDIAIQDAWADLRSVHPKPKGLQERIERAQSLYPCDVLFVHRDAEAQPPETRIEEIERAVSSMQSLPEVVPVVPVRMQEAWLLFNEPAIRRAAGNPNGTEPLQIAGDFERMPDPKDVLHEALRIASGLSGRRRKKFRVRSAAAQVTGFIDDFSPLRALAAFQQLEDSMHGMLHQNNWHR